MTVRALSTRAYTQRIDEETGEDIIWIISARKAGRREARQYHET
jgi:uncharacterized DUF497 family protein